MTKLRSRDGGYSGQNGEDHGRKCHRFMCRRCNNPQVFLGTPCLRRMWHWRILESSCFSGTSTIRTRRGVIKNAIAPWNKTQRQSVSMIQCMPHFRKAGGSRSSNMTLAGYHLVMKTKTKTKTKTRIHEIHNACF